MSKSRASPGDRQKQSEYPTLSPSPLSTKKLGDNATAVASERWEVVKEAATATLDGNNSPTEKPRSLRVMDK